MLELSTLGKLSFKKFTRRRLGSLARLIFSNCFRLRVPPISSKNNVLASVWNVKDDLGHSIAQCLSLFIAPDCHCSRKSVDQVLLNSSLSRCNFTGDKCFSQENFVYMLTPSGSLGPSV